MAPTSVYRIEKGTRPVRVRELLAFARAFGVDDPLDLLTPLELIDDDRARTLVESFAAALEDLIRAADQMWRAERNLMNERGPAAKIARTHTLHRLREWDGEMEARTGDHLEERFDMIVREAVYMLMFGGMAEAVTDLDPEGGWVSFKTPEEFDDLHLGGGLRGRVRTAQVLAAVMSKQAATRKEAGDGQH